MALMMTQGDLSLVTAETSHIFAIQSTIFSVLFGSRVWIQSPTDLKEYNSVQVTECAFTNKIAEVRVVDQGCTAATGQNYAKVESGYWKRNHKFEMQVPKTVKEAFVDPTNTGMDFWLKAIERKWRSHASLQVPWKRGADTDRLPVSDIYMSDFTRTRKARFVADGHTTTDTPAPLT
jgi:hypothetical protein